MEYSIPKHLLLVRHGESEGDLRRSSKNQPMQHELRKHPHDEEQTTLGHEQSASAGRWLVQYVLDNYGIDRFDWQISSPLIRTTQSAQSLGLKGIWRTDDRLAERNRGDIQGMTRRQHQEVYPDSFRLMNEVPFHWTPPGGESIMRTSHRLGQLVDEFMISEANSAIFMTHRDLMWAAHLPLDGLTLTEIEQLDTDDIKNSQIYHYSNINPDTGEINPKGLSWKRSITPWSNEADSQTDRWYTL